MDNYLRLVSLLEDIDKIINNFNILELESTILVLRNILFYYVNIKNIISFDNKNLIDSLNDILEICTNKLENKRNEQKISRTRFYSI